MLRLSAPRWAAALAAILLAGASLRECHSESIEREAALRPWEASDASARHATVASRARRDPDPAASGTALARVLFAEASEVGHLAALPPEEAAAAARRAERELLLAAELARNGLARRPASWESAMILGGFRLIAAARTPGDEPYLRPERWRAPLRQAAALAPGSPEPTKLLVTGYLASWHALSPAERAQGRLLVRDAFRDEATMQQLLPAWAAVANSSAELEAALPRDPEPYDLLQQAAARQGDWAGYCAARGRWAPLTMDALQRQLAEAERRLDGGDASGARTALLATAVAARPDRRTAALFGEAIDRLPPGQVGSAEASAFAAWLDWALPLWQIGVDAEPLSRAVLARLASIAPDLPPAQAATAALAAGDLERAEIWERRADRLWSPEWAAYATAKAEALLARGHSDEAAAVLDEVHRTFQDRWAYLQAREHLAGARSEPLAVRPEALAAVTWGPERWFYKGPEASLELVASVNAPALVVDVDVAPEEGAAIELAWDGAATGCVPVRAGRAVRLPLRVTAGPHRLAWRTLAGGRTAPGSVELVGAGTP